MFRAGALHLSVNFIILVLGCFGNFPVNMASSKPNVSVKSVGDISKACNSFCQDLYKIIASTEKKNVVHSPFGLHTLLSLLSYGADTTTLEELKKALHFSDAQIHQQYKELITYLNTAESLELTVSNAIYVQDEFPIIQEFLDLCSNSFHAEIANVDFANPASAIGKINSWVKTKTKDKIQSALQPTDIDRFTRVILLNVIHFKSTWLHQFNANKTTLRDFHVSKSVVKRVPTMATQAVFKSGEIPMMEASFIEIPYKNSEFVMVIVKPNEIDGLQKLESAFDASILSSSESMEQTFLLKLPKFKFEITTQLNDILQQVDIKIMFTDDADFSKISNYKQPLKVSKVFQKLYVDVNEEGTEAAAVTVGVMRLKRCLEIIPEFIIDRPFMFVIKHKSRDIPLFVGSVRDFEDAEMVEQTRDEL